MGSSRSRCDWRGARSGSQREEKPDASARARACLSTPSSTSGNGPTSKTTSAKRSPSRRQIPFEGGRASPEATDDPVQDIAAQVSGAPAAGASRGSSVNQRSDQSGSNSSRAPNVGVKSPCGPVEHEHELLPRRSHRPNPPATFVEARDLSRSEHGEGRDRYALTDARYSPDRHAVISSRGAAGGRSRSATNDNDRRYRGQLCHQREGDHRTERHAEQCADRGASKRSPTRR
jgi:hypothetical protein